MAYAEKQDCFVFEDNTEARLVGLLRAAGDLIVVKGDRARGDESE